MLTEKMLETYSLMALYPAGPYQRSQALGALVRHLAEMDALKPNATEEEHDDEALAFAARRVRPWGARA